MVMRERTHLDTSVNGYRALERELSDSIELIEMGEAEGDESVVKDAEATLLALKDKAAKLELESLLSGEADANDCYQCRSWRHRGPGLGRNDAADVSALGGTARLQDRMA
jgi:hypothetical protein